MEVGRERGEGRKREGETFQSRSSSTSSSSSSSSPGIFREEVLHSLLPPPPIKPRILLLDSVSSGIGGHFLR